MKIVARRILYYATSAVALGALVTPAVAQGMDDEIIVTARKRDETSIAVPVVLTAVGGAELERRGINGVDNLARMVPALLIGEGGGTPQGGNITIRGVSSADSNNFADQAVSFNVDGVQVARASIRRMAEMDLQQVEVLKGPQALFFGKNSPGGIISIRSADPTQTLQAKVSAGYEFRAREKKVEGFISGPLTDTLGLRLAAYGSTMEGWLKGTTPKTLPFAPQRDRFPRRTEFAVRGTLKFDTDKFDARLKVTYGKVNGTHYSGIQQNIDCPLGRPQLGGLDDCTANNRIARIEPGPTVAARDPRFREGVGYAEQYQILGSLEMNYHLSDALTLTSVTGYYKMDLQAGDNVTVGTVPSTMIASGVRLQLRDVSEELRLASSFDGPINFMVGGHYQTSRARQRQISLLNILTAGFLAQQDVAQRGKAYSVFGQVMWDIIPTIELSAGGRYSWEKKRLPFTRQGSPLTAVQTPIDHDKWKNFSPEVTLSWRPSGDLTVFASYKRGFLSGGFNSANSNFLISQKFDQQTIRGFEGGVKASLADGHIRTNFSLYSYKIYGLQITNLSYDANNIPFASVVNAGKVSLEGAEFDVNYRTPLQGLSLRAAVAYNKARYDIFTAPCYRGQVRSTGCGDLNLQNLAGQQIARAPDWTGNAGFNFETPVGGNLKFGLSGDVNYSDSYFTDIANKPRGKMPHYAQIDATVRVGAEDDNWEIALLGRNLTNKLYWTRTVDAPLTGTAGSGAVIEPTNALLADTYAPLSRAREIMVRFTKRLGN